MTDLWEAQMQKKIKGLQEDLERANNLVLDLFNQCCGITPYGVQELNDFNKFKYDHMCLSAYEDAQDYLIKIGKIKPTECSRK